MATMEQLMTGMAANFDPNVKDINGRIQFNFTGDDPGSWYLDIANGQAQAVQGTAENPSVSVSTDSTTWKDLVGGRLNPMTAFLTGKVKAQGDMGLLMRLQSLFKA